MNCSELENLLPSYALDALDPEDASRVEEHLESCPWCYASLREHLRVAAALAQGAPQVQPAASVKRDVMRALDPRAPAGTALGRRPLFTPRLLWATAASVVLLLLAGGIALQFRLFGQIDDLQEENEALMAQVEGMSQDSDQLLDLFAQQAPGSLAELATLTAQERAPDQGLSQFVQQQRIMAYIIASMSQTVLTLEGGEESPGAHGMLTIAGKGNMGILVAEGLEPLPPDSAYQVWLWKDGHPHSGGLFSVDTKGWGTIMLDSDEPITSYTGIHVTLEPSEGSLEPTGATALIASIDSD